MLCVLSANYNNALYLVDFFESLLHSSIKPTQIVFVDDGSTDNSLLIAQHYTDKLPLEIISLPSNVGFGNALNLGMIHCKQPFIARIDPDDMAAPDRFELQIDFLKRNPSIDVIGSQAVYFDSKSKRIIGNTNMPISETGVGRAFHLGDNGVLHGTVTIRKDVLRSYHYKQAEVPSEDYGLFSRMYRDGVRMVSLPQSLTRVRVHSNSVSNNLKLSTVEKVFQIRQEVFGIPAHPLLVFLEFLCLRFYRQALFSNSFFLRFFYLFLAGAFGPRRVISKIRTYMTRYNQRSPRTDHS